MIIQHLKNFCLKCQIHPLTLIYLLLSLMSGYLKWYLASLMIVCIHELCHLLMAYSFHFQIKKIEILPFGAYLSLEDFYFHPIWQEICVVLAGPCSHLLIFFCINFFDNGVFKEYLLDMNRLVFLFNLMPIYPLDGSRIIGLILQRLMDLKKSLYFHFKLSVFSLCILTLFYFQTQTIVIISYLYLQHINYWKFIPCYLRKYYSQIPTLSCHRRVIVHQDLSYRRGYLNYYRLNNNLYHEKQMMYILIENVKKI